MGNEHDPLTSTKKSSDRIVHNTQPEFKETNNFRTKITKATIKFIRKVGNKTSFAEPALLLGIYSLSRLYGVSLELHAIVHGIDALWLAKWSLAKIAPLPIICVYHHLEGSMSNHFWNNIKKSGRKAIRFYRTPVSETMHTAQQVKSSIRKLYETIQTTEVHLPAKEFKDVSWAYNNETTKIRIIISNK